MNEVAKKMLAKSNNSRLEKFGKTITFCCMSLIVFVVALILIFVAQKGLSTFFVNKVNVFSFLFGSTWNPSGKEFGALPMILGSFIVTLLSALVLLLMSLAFNSVIKLITKERGKKNYAR